MFGTADVQEPASGPFGGRVLGDQFGGEGEVEVVDGQRHGAISIRQTKQKRLSVRKADLS
jgi:hypothetical protein